MNLDYDAVAVGDALPEFKVVPTLLGAVMYCAAMWEFQKIHFDHDWAKSRENLDGAIIQGPVLGNYLARCVMGWAGPRARLTRLAWRNHGVAPLEEQLVCSGRVCARRAVEATERNVIGMAGVIDCELAIVNPRGEKIVSGSASVALAQATREPA